VSRYETFPGEGVSSVLWNYPAVFQAKAYALQQPYAELAKYIDAPAFQRGDLFHIQNMVATLQATTLGPTHQPRLDSEYWSD
ncbi:MAG: hypothetical protein ACNA8H_11840, partial [Anaerolineales bacterium]